MSDISEILNSIKAYLETDKLSGIKDIMLASSLDEPRPDPSPLKAAGGTLEELLKSAGECDGCQLHKRRTNLVFGSGNPKARLMFVGEAPGGEEDLQGLPFVGRAGQLLTKMIEAIDMNRGDVYIANILKCRPPNNRNPMPEEIAACAPFLREQISIIRPKIICTLGKFASQFLLQSEEPITALRGRFHKYEGIKLMPTYHPAYLLRNPPAKKFVWEDLKKIRDELKKT